MDQPPREGDIFAGKYRVEKVLGRGGMGVVFRAHHLGLDEPVAIKVVSREVLEVPGIVERFVLEARAATRITSEHVVRVRDIDTLPSGEPYMVMECLDGMNLLELYKQRLRFEVHEAVGYVLEACEAIAEAHALGIVHRDLKPPNLFLARRRDGTTLIKVLDFGIALLVRAHDNEGRLTKPGQIMGSANYMPPEQITSPQDVDTRADIWALGAVLYRILAGAPPFRGDTEFDVFDAVLTARPRPPRKLRPDLPPELEAVILRCLEKDRSRRFQTVEALVEALQPFAHREPAPVVLPSKRNVRPPAVYVLVGGLAVIATALAWLVVQAASAPPPAP